MARVAPRGGAGGGLLTTIALAGLAARTVKASPIALWSIHRRIINTPFNAVILIRRTSQSGPRARLRPKRS
jgi:hypothetical protein